MFGPAWDARAARWAPRPGVLRGSRRGHQPRAPPGRAPQGADLEGAESEFVRPAWVPQARSLVPLCAPAPLLSRDCVCVCVQGRVCKGHAQQARL